MAQEKVTFHLKMTPEDYAEMKKAKEKTGISMTRLFIHGGKKEAREQVLRQSNTRHGII